jgi:2-polyprenyl-3-methyl-5-hydroxy-6-metoxy-1,4-benzoquinol methylase
VEDVDFNFSAGQFDCIVCADILEHLREPGDVLKKLKRWLTPDGTLVISIPNVRHHSVITSLLAGNWTYESAGLLDNDHVRFFK